MSSPFKNYHTALGHTDVYCAESLLVMTVHDISYDDMNSKWCVGMCCFDWTCPQYMGSKVVPGKGDLGFGANVNSSA